MIDKKEAKSAYKLSKKVGAVVAYKNLLKHSISIFDMNSNHFYQ